MNINYSETMTSFSNKQMTTESLPAVQQVVFEKLDSRFKKSQLISTVLFFTVMLMILFAAILYASQFHISVIWYVLACTLRLILFSVSIFYVFKSYDYEGYALREKDILYQSGVLFRSTVIVPFNRVQHCEIQQGPIDRYFGLGNLLLYTAGGSSSDLIVNGLSYDTALILKETITQKIVLDEGA